MTDQSHSKGIPTWDEWQDTRLVLLLLLLLLLLYQDRGYQKHREDLYDVLPNQIPSHTLIYL